MARGNHFPFWTHDTVAAAVLAGVGAASLQIKLDALANDWNIPVLTACLHGWPMLLILVGVVMLLVQPGPGDRERKRQDDGQAAEERAVVSLKLESPARAERGPGARGTWSKPEALPFTRAS